MKIAILAYEKPQALSRLLDSVAQIPDSAKPEIYIFIDKNNDPQISHDVYEAANKHIVTEIYITAHRLGLRNNMLRVFHWCAELNEPVLVLEDDLWVAPGAMNYAHQAIAFYRRQEDIGMISLYHQHYVAGTEFPHLPLHDGYDNYFLQMGSSSGFIICPEQASQFLNYSDHDDFYISRNLPGYMQSWPLNSWKKIFNAWLLDTQKTVVYPRISYVTNFGDSGTHHVKSSHHFQSPVSMAVLENHHFSHPEESLARYDIYSEWIPGDHHPEWKDTDFDLNGLKPASAITRGNVVTIKKSKFVQQTFGRALKPQELNIIQRIPGSTFYLMESQHFEAAEMPVHQWEALADYHYIFTSGRKLAAYLKRKLFNS